MSPKGTLSRITGGVGGYREDAKAEGLQRQGDAPHNTDQCLWYLEAFLPKAFKRWD